MTYRPDDAPASDDGLSRLGTALAACPPSARRLALRPKECGLGKLIATTQATIDRVVDPVGQWVQADVDRGDYCSTTARSSGLVLGRKTRGAGGIWPTSRANGRTWSMRWRSSSGPTPSPAMRVERTLLRETSRTRSRSSRSGLAVTCSCTERRSLTPWPRRA